MRFRTVFIFTLLSDKRGANHNTLAFISQDSTLWPHVVRRGLRTAARCTFTQQHRTTKVLFFYVAFGYWNVCVGLIGGVSSPRDLARVSSHLFPSETSTPTTPHLAYTTITVTPPPPPTPPATHRGAYKGL